MVAGGFLRQPLNLILRTLFFEHWDLAPVLGDAARAEGTAFGLGELISFFVLLLGYIGDGIGSYFRKGRESMAHPA